MICESTTFSGIIFHFFGDFSVIKARKLHQTRCKTCPFDALADEKLIDNPAGGSSICNYGQESWDKFTLSAFLSARKTRIQSRLPSLVEFDLDQSEHKSSQVNASARKLALAKRSRK